MNIYKLGLLASSILILTACGGGGGGGGEGSSNNSQTPTNPQPPVITNQKPIANAGYDQTIEIGSYLRLVGNGSDADNDSLIYRWSVIEKPSQSKVLLTKVSERESTFTPDVQGQYVIQLVVNDGKQDSNPSTIKVNVTQSTPIADAGNLQNITLGDALILDGSKSYDYDKDYITYYWTIESKPSNSNLTIPFLDIYKVNPTLTPDVQGKYIFNLVVHDGKVHSTKSTVEVNVAKGNSAPVAKIQDVSPEYKVGSKVLLDSNSSDADGDPLTYNWVLESKPENSLAQLSLSTTVRPTIILDSIGAYKISLVVNDGKVSSNKDTIILNSWGENSAPIADAGINQSAVTDQTVRFDGSQSTDPENDALTYTWSIVSKPENSKSSLYGEKTAYPSFKPDIEGTYIFGLIVNDGRVTSKPSSVTLNVKHKPEIILSSSDFFSTYIHTFPFSKSTSFDISYVCTGGDCTGVTIDQFTLEAKGREFTIVDVKATTSDTSYPVFFTNLREGTIIRENQKLTFDLRVLQTQGKTVNLTYSFKIKETGQTFKYSATGRTK